MSKSENNADTVTVEKTEITFPGKYNVILHNDDITPMGFVVEILIEIFKMEQQNAIKLMLEIHNNGKGVAGTYIKSIAESKAALVREVSMKAEYPLTVSVEEA